MMCDDNINTQEQKYLHYIIKYNYWYICVKKREIRDKAISIHQAIMTTI